MIENTETPFPEVEQHNQDTSLKAEYAALLAREAQEAEAELNAKLDSIAQSGDASELKSNMALRIKFTERHGWEAFANLNQKHLQRADRERLAAELEAKQSKRNVSTTQGRIAQLNKSRRAAN